MSEALPLLSWLWTPLVAVTAAAGDRRSGQIAVTAHGASIVPERPRLNIALWKTNYTPELVTASGAFAVHLLHDQQDELVYHLGLQSGRDTDKFASLAWSSGQTGTPLLHDCLAVFECRLLNQMDAGDHTVFIGEVVHSALHGTGRPLWWRDLRSRIPEARLQAWFTKNSADIDRARQVTDLIAGG